MSNETSDDDLMAVVRRVYTESDPVPEGLVARMQAAVAVAGTDWDAELMALVERSEALAGARSAATTAYTLRFESGGTEVLVRVAVDDPTSRVDGWLVPAAPMTVRVLDQAGTELASAPLSSTGRFELSDLARGLVRLRLEPADGATVFTTPLFEI